MEAPSLPRPMAFSVAPDAADRLDAIRTLGDAIVDADDDTPFRSHVPGLVAQLTDESSEVRILAAWALGCLGRSALDAVEGLAARLVVEAEASVRMSLIDALAEIAPPPRAAAEAMFGAELLKPAPPDPDPARTARASAAGLAALERGLGDADADVRKRAVRGIGQWGRHGRSLEHAIAKFLHDPDAGTRYVAVMACRYVGASADAALEGLLFVIADAPPGPRSRPLKDPRPPARRAAVVLVGDMGPAARSALPILRSFADDPEIGESVPAALRKLEGVRR